MPAAPGVSTKQAVFVLLAVAKLRELQHNQHTLACPSLVEVPNTARGEVLRLDSFCSPRAGELV